MADTAVVTIQLPRHTLVTVGVGLTLSGLALAVWFRKQSETGAVEPRTTRTALLSKKQKSDRGSKRSFRRRPRRYTCRLPWAKDSSPRHNSTGTISASSDTEDILAVYASLAGEDGKITLLRWKEICSELNMGLSKSALERTFESVDADGSGAIDFDDFLASLSSVGITNSILQMHSAAGVLQTKFDIPPDYDFTRSTSENYGTNDLNFFGTHADIRAACDYNWHVNYTRERQQWQDAVINSVVLRTLPQQEPWIVYTCGPMGAGKTHVLRWLSEHNYFPVENIVKIDPDHFKEMMPEWDQYTEQSQAAGSMCHKESALMQEIAQEVALRRRQNIWVDGSLRDSQWYGMVFDNIRNRFPEYSIAIFHVYAGEAVVRKRLQARCEETGRCIPEDLIKDSLEATETSIESLRHKVDIVARILNDGDPPQLLSLETYDRTGSFSCLREHFETQTIGEEKGADSFKGTGNRRFPQYHAPETITRTALRLSHFVIDTNELAASESSGVPISVILKASAIRQSQYGNLLHDLLQASHITETNGSLKLKLGPVSRFSSRLKDIDSESTQRDPIPANATYVAFSYPIPTITGSIWVTLRRKGLPRDDACINFLRHGALLHFDSEFRLLAVNARGVFDMANNPYTHTFSLSSPCSVIRYGRPIRVSQQCVQWLVAHHRLVQTRKNEIAIDRTYLAWVRPGEVLDQLATTDVSLWVNGGLIYVFGPLPHDPHDAQPSSATYHSPRFYPFVSNAI